MTDPVPVPVIHHVTLTVTDVARSVDWYQGLFGPAIVLDRQGPTWTRQRMQWPSGLIIGVSRHDDTTAQAFDCTRVGLDHIGLDCADEAEVRAWAQRLDHLGYEHGPVESVAYGWAVTARDPDGIAIEFFAARPTLASDSPAHAST